MPTISELLIQAESSRLSGDTARTEELVRQILQAEPENADALHLLGLAFHARSRLAEAVEQYQKVLRIDPTRFVVANDLGTALAMQGRLEEAIITFREVIRLKPDHAPAYHNLGNALRIMGRPEEAEPHLREARRLTSASAAVPVSPAIAQALASMQKTLQLNPNVPEVHNDLGNVWLMAGQLDKAIVAYRQAIALRPTFALAHSNLGSVLCKQGLLDEGIAAFQEAVRLQPDFADAYNNLGCALKDHGQLDEAIACYQHAKQLKPTDHGYHSSLLSLLHYHPSYDSLAILTEHRRWEAEHAGRYAGIARSFLNDRGPERRLRIGYISPDFRDHVVGRNVWPLLRNHDHGQFEITLYANMTGSDSFTEQFQRCADRWYTIARWLDERVADQIRQDRIDILVDLALHTYGNRLLVCARKPAPVQVTFAGYPGTTGLSAIDYRLTDPYLDPPGSNDALYAEESYRLPHSFWCYDPQGEEPGVGALPALGRGFVTFGCLNNPCKVNNEVLELWAQVLRAVPGSRLKLLAKQGSPRKRTLAFLGRRGIAAERVEFVLQKPRSEYLALYHDLDIGLDTFPYNGHTTSLDSFWMGAPVITLVGRTVVGRAGLSQLTNLNLAELAAFTPNDFVRLATDLAGDLPRLAALRSGLRERMQQSPLMNAYGFAAGIEQAYRVMWRKWCAREDQK